MTLEEAYRAGYQAGKLSMPDIVMCKDCKHGKKHNINIIECMKAHDYNLEHQEFHHKNWYCADGKRQ